MTKEEQIDWLFRLRTDLSSGIIFTPWNEEFIGALDSVFAQESYEDAIKYFDDIYKLSQTYGVTYSFVEDKIKDIVMALKALPQESCDDCISRRAVLDALDKNKYSNVFCEEHHIDWSINLGMAHIVVNKLKPITPQPKMGYWRDTGSGQECSECGEIQYGYDNFRKYCANCGAKMEEVK